MGVAFLGEQPRACIDDTAAVSHANVEIVRQIFAAWERRDPGMGVELLDPSIELDSTQSEWFPEVQGVFHGHEGVQLFWGRFFELMVEMDYAVENIIDAGDEVLVQFTAGGRGRQSGAPFQRRLVNVYTLEQGRVTRLRIFASLADATAAVGI
jgi:ketosteroid isomerase-like protein